MMTFSQRPFTIRQRGKSTIEFNTNSATGYVPLLKLVSTMSGGNSDYLQARITSMKDVVLHEINFYQTHNVFSFKKRMKQYKSATNPVSTIAVSLLSVLGFTGEPNRLVSKGIRNGDLGQHTVMLTNKVDVFALAVVKISDISKIDMSGGQIKIDPSLITILVNDSFRGQYLNDYNVTVAKYLRENLRKVTRENEIEVKHISDEEMKGYYRNPHSITTNSIFEIMEIDKKVKVAVLPKIISQKLMEVND